MSEEVLVKLCPSEAHVLFQQVNYPALERRTQQFQNIPPF